MFTSTDTQKKGLNYFAQSKGHKSDTPENDSTCIEMYNECAKSLLREGRTLERWSTNAELVSKGFMEERNWKKRMCALAKHTEE